VRADQPQRSGPRHAAPRKSLLTKIQVPAGKVIAIAAMPTAVLMGMGLTPHLAQADEPSSSTFSGTSCADTSPSAAPSASSSSSVSSESGKVSSDAAKPRTAATPGATAHAATPHPSTTTPKPTATGGTGTGADSGGGTVSHGTQSLKTGSSGSGGSSGASGAAAGASPSPTASTLSAARQSDPLDPLGIGDAIGKLLGIGGKGGGASPTPGGGTTPQPTATARPTGTAQPGGGATTPKPTTTPHPGATGSNSGSGATHGPAGTTTHEKAAREDATVSRAVPAPSASGSASASASSGTTGTDGASPYPCPTHDAKALADADLEQTPALLPDDPWTLESTMLTLSGLNYDGLVKVKTEGGTVKTVMKFTATGVDIKDLHQLTKGPNGSTYHVKASSGSTSTIKDGTVTMYTQELKGKLLGIIPVDFTPDEPPPLTLPVLFFTDVTVVQAGQFGGTLTIPGMHLYRD
jgi:hypothetical protein